MNYTYLALAALALFVAGLCYWTYRRLGRAVGRDPALHVADALLQEKPSTPVAPPPKARRPLRGAFADQVSLTESESAAVAEAMRKAMSEPDPAWLATMLQLAADDGPPTAAIGNRRDGDVVLRGGRALPNYVQQGARVAVYGLPAALQQPFREQLEQLAARRHEADNQIAAYLAQVEAQLWEHVQHPDTKADFAAQAAERAMNGCSSFGAGASLARTWVHEILVTIKAQLANATAPTDMGLRVAQEIRRDAEARGH